MLSFTRANHFGVTLFLTHSHVRLLQGVHEASHLSGLGGLQEGSKHVRVRSFFLFLSSVLRTRSLSSVLVPTFLGEGSPTKIDKTEKHRVPTYSELLRLEDLAEVSPLKGASFQGEANESRAQNRFG